MTSDDIMSLFCKLNSEDGITIILVTHELNVAQYAKRILHFKDGIITDDKINNDRRGVV